MATVSKQVPCPVIIIGAGIAGLATLKCMLDAGFQVLLLEKTGDTGGLWKYSEDRYGVMNFTHINVSRENYSFSDYPFPDDIPDFPHHVQMAEYIQNYAKHFELLEHVKFYTNVKSVDKKGDKWLVHVEQQTSEQQENCETIVYECTFLAIATGHHSKPNQVDFPGLNSFTGKVYHSVEYKDALFNDTVNKHVVVVGVGNSAVDVACHCAEAGRCKPVYLSTRSGAWVVPNYVMGRPIDHYACRLFLWLPWKLASWIFEGVITFIYGHPSRYGLNPKMHVLQTQPTVSPTLIHNIQRQKIIITPNIKEVQGGSVTFMDGQTVQADHIILCTGYSIHLPFLHQDLKKAVSDDSNNELKLYKNVFSPELGHSLAFIGFVQPASGGVLMMSELQARWWAELCRGTCQLPAPHEMLSNMYEEQEYVKKRWYSSKRHTIQRDPLLYCDELADMIGCKPPLSFRLLLGCGGASQYRLQGPGKWSGAQAAVSKVKVTSFMIVSSVLLVVTLLWVLFTAIITIKNFC